MLKAKWTHDPHKAGRIRSTVKAKGLIGNRTSNITVCSIVLQPTILRAPIYWHDISHLQINKQLDININLESRIDANLFCTYIKHRLKNYFKYAMQTDGVPLIQELLTQLLTFCTCRCAGYVCSVTLCEFQFMQKVKLKNVNIYQRK
jgi:hypothetical protein